MEELGATFSAQGQVKAFGIQHSAFKSLRLEILVIPIIPFFSSFPDGDRLRHEGAYR